MVSPQSDTNGGVKESSVPPHPKRRQVSLIIPAYWLTPELEFMTAKCLASIRDVRGLIEKIIVNDGSPSIGKISILHPQYATGQLDKRIDLETNNGYSHACNVGLRDAEGEILILGNNDLIFPKGWLKGLLDVLDKGYDIATCWTSDQKVKLEDRIEEGAKFGSLWAMKRHVYEKLGGFDEQFRGYFSDTDYRRRAIDAGFKIGKNLNMKVKHEAKATYKMIDPNDDEFLRSQRLFEAKYGFVE